MPIRCIFDTSLAPDRGRILRSSHVPSPLPILPAEPTASGPEQPRGLALFRLGFRPFYLGAAGFAAVAVPVWVALWLTGAALPSSLTPLHWHAHEMLFGFAVAVIIGFLLTASRAWTGLDTPRGVALAALAMLWLAARVAAVTGPPAWYALLDLPLLPLAAAALASVLWRAGNRRNLPLVGLLLLMFVANLAFHLAEAGWVAWPPMAALHAGLALIVMIESVMAGRVVPAFTANVTPGLRIPPRPALERATLGFTGAALAAWALGLDGPLVAGLLAVAGALHLHRCWRWRPRVTLGRPILWILHAAYVWIPIGLWLLAAASLGLLGKSPGVHALAVGATGGLIIGMITRTARGHTGRPLVASRAEVAAYLLVMLAALLRAVLPALATASWLLESALWLAAGAWGAAFALYLGRYGPWLTRPRLDGKDG